MSKTHKTDRCHDLLCTCGQAVSWSVVLEQLYIIVSLLRACLKEMFYPCLVIVSKNFQENCIGETVFFLLFLGDVLSESQPRNTVKPTNVCYLGGVLLCCWLYHISLSLQSCLLNISHFMLRPFISYSLPMFYDDKAGGTLSFCFSDNKVLIRKHMPHFSCLWKGIATVYATWFFLL